MKIRAGSLQPLLISILLLASLSFKSEKVLLHKRIYIQGNYFTTDNLGNCFIVDKDEITKYDGNGAVFNKFSIKAFGSIESIDACNPLKLMVFYKDFAKLVFLDNTLSLNGSPIDLEELNLSQAKLACVSHSDGFWLYDQQKFALVRVDQSLSIAENTSDLNQLLGININPNYLCEYNNSVYLNNPETGILVFDVFGAYVKTIPLLHLTKFHVTNNAIYYIQNNKVISYNLKTTSQAEVKLIDMNYSEVRTEKGMIYAKNTDLIDILKLE